VWGLSIINKEEKEICMRIRSKRDIEEKKQTAISYLV
jgi:hypothetical protein